MRKKQDLKTSRDLSRPLCNKKRRVPSAGKTPLVYKRIFIPVDQGSLPGRSQVAQQSPWQKRTCYCSDSCRLRWVACKAWHIPTQVYLRVSVYDGTSELCLSVCLSGRMSVCMYVCLSVFMSNQSNTGIERYKCFRLCEKILFQTNISKSYFRLKYS